MIGRIAVVACALAAMLPAGCQKSEPLDSGTSATVDVLAEASPAPVAEPSPPELPPPQSAPPPASPSNPPGANAAESGSHQDPQSGSSLESLTQVFEQAGQLADQGRLVEAIALLDQIPADDPIAGLPALGQAADWCLQMGDGDGAERRYLQILRSMPDANLARRQLAFLYNCQGRRHEAAQLIRALCRQGDVLEDELYALASTPDAIHVPAKSGDGDVSDPVVAGDRRYVGIGPVASARHDFTQRRYADAASGLRPLLESSDAPPSVWALYGRVVSESGDDKAFAWWRSEVDESIRTQSEYWIAIGVDHLRRNRFEDAAGCLIQALVIEPADLRAHFRLRQAFVSLGLTEPAETCSRRILLLNEMRDHMQAIQQTDPPSADDYAAVADDLEQLGHRLESLLWRFLGLSYQRQRDPDGLRTLNRQRLELVDRGGGFPTESDLLGTVYSDRFAAVEGPKLSEPAIDPVRPIPRSLPAVPRPSLAGDKTPGQSSERVAPNFVNAAKRWGLVHSYRIAPQPQSSAMAIYQQLGGGAALTDFDRDGCVDVYLAQGIPTSTGSDDRQWNRLLRLQPSSDHSQPAYHDVSDRSHLDDAEFSLGVTAGDWNQDGFDDLFVSNLGRDRGWINQGDGTFREFVFPRGSDDPTAIDTSLAIADITGDHLPDLVQLRYVQDPTIVDRPTLGSDGKVDHAFGPKRYQPANDRIWINDGRGGAMAHAFGRSKDTARAGLGLWIGDIDGQTGNEVFVANDQDPNQLWAHDQSSQEIRFDDTGVLRGLAFDGEGHQSAAMGVAVGDWDQNGWADFLVTNFAKETNSLYLNRQGQFQDRSIAYRVDLPSRSMVGFGTQAIDDDNDGRQDYVVTNGHIDDIRNEPEGFAQPFQWMKNDGAAFSRQAVIGDEYFGRRHVGRAMVTGDLNRDGRMDLLVTHLNEPMALLINQFPSSGHHVQVELVGRTSERNPIGARVKIVAGGSTWTQSHGAGDGYLARNEPILHFGLGEHTSIDRIEVRWPSGITQQWESLDVDQRIVLIEQISDPFPLANP